MDLIQVFNDTLEKTSDIPINVNKFKVINIHNDIEISNINCIDAVINTRKYYNDSYKIGLLNFASGMERGGGVTRGSKAQEEDICRTTNLYHTLNEKYYPIRDNEIIISKNVKLIKNSSYQDIKPINIDYILTKDAVVAYNGQFNNAMYEEAERRIEMIIKTAHALKIDILILGAFGCGVFRNPPEHVASLFKKSLKRYSFKKVIFAILEKNNTLNNIFKNILGK
jgi:uncharacterized protein (TIGR02452 family)